MGFIFIYNIFGYLHMGKNGKMLQLAHGVLLPQALAGGCQQTCGILQNLDSPKSRWAPGKQRAVCDLPGGILVHLYSWAARN